VAFEARDLVAKDRAPAPIEGAPEPTAPADLDLMLTRLMEHSDLGTLEARVLAMSELEGMDATEIAKSMGKSRGSVDTALSRARKKISDAM
jgi:DNA-directed RNA polymerase specialized sigma24 family protein